MLLRSFKLPLRRRRNRAQLLLFTLALVLLIDTVRITVPTSPGIRISPTSTAVSRRPRIFIASIHWNNEAILRSHWNSAVLDLVRYFGPENVHVRILESGSWDDSKGALRDLDLDLANLGAQRTIELDEKTHKDEIGRVPSPEEAGWIWTSRGKKELRRIPYLARLRNRVMKTMTELAREGDSGKFDKVLWLNDVVFTTEDVLTLLETRNGEYAAACSLDFSKPPYYYDTFALRDQSGAKPITQTWPYFLSYASRHALMSNEPVPVTSCWNGIAVFDAAPFYQPSSLKFRGIPDSLAVEHLEGSECCLVHADNPLSVQKGVWLNPNVRVGYNANAYKAVNPGVRDWVGTRGKVLGVWKNRWARIVGWPRRLAESWVVHWRVRSWQAQNVEPGYPNEETGVHCIINEMQVLIENGWAHL